MLYYLSCTVLDIIYNHTIFWEKFWSSVKSRRLVGECSQTLNMLRQSTSTWPSLMRVELPIGSGNSGLINLWKNLVLKKQYLWDTTTSFSHSFSSSLASQGVPSFPSWKSWYLGFLGKSWKMIESSYPVAFGEDQFDEYVTERISPQRLRQNVRFQNVRSPIGLVAKRSILQKASFHNVWESIGLNIWYSQTSLT